LIEALWREPNALLSHGELLRNRGARKTARIEWQEKWYILKMYAESTRRHALKQTVVRSRARKTWAIAHRLADAGVPTPRPSALIENRWGLLRGQSFLLYPYVDGTTLRSCLQSDILLTESLASYLQRQLAELWHRLVTLRISLADANLGNFIVEPAGRLWVIDVDKARYHRVPQAASRQHRRGWQQLNRSAVRAGTNAEHFVREIGVVEIA
jgi:tRNA A-37 threonylcarbamoyl transferase component Bud32